MIRYDEAFALMMAAARPLPAEEIPLDEASGRVLATDVNSDIDMPPFDKSAMDGYACRREDLAAGELEIVEEIPAGEWPRRTIGPGTCSRILTGAPVPEGADCVLMQEQAERTGTRLRIVDPKTGDHICRRGEDIRAGARVLARGGRIGPAHIAVLATVGAARPLVACCPRVAVMATGSELVDPSACPGPAQIRNSNGWQLAAQVRAMGAHVVSTGMVPDTEDAIAAAVSEAMPSADLLLLSGGVSTGDYDLVPGILRRLGFTSIFESIAMQPGRPTVFARRNDVCCCGLPGNPVAAFLVFETLVKPFLYRMMGHDLQPRTVEARMAVPLQRRLTQRQSNILVRFISPNEVEPVEYHGPAHINAVTRADGIVVVPVGEPGIEKGDTVRVRLVPA